MIGRRRRPAPTTGPARAPSAGRPPAEAAPGAGPAAAPAGRPDARDGERGRVAACWRDALALWDVSVNLSPPEPFARGAWRPGERPEPLAYIDLSTRQVVVNFERLEAFGARDSLTAVLAHEIGHHVRFPHTLGVAAALQVLEGRLIPGLRQSLTNLFFDLQVNEVVGRTLADALCAVYRGAVASDASADAPSPLFAFFLAVQEELWGLAPGALVPAARAEGLEAAYPGFRGDARMFAQTFFGLPDTVLQFVYFCSCFARYLPDPTSATYQVPMGADVPFPDVDDVDGALQGGAAIDGALAEARRRGWIAEGEGATDADPLAAIERITRHAPGHGLAAFRRILVARHYRRLVDRHLIEVPGEPPPPPEPLVPTLTEAWEPGDDPRAIDWTLSVLAAGPLAALRPLRREWEPDPPADARGSLAAVEIYLDTSGSMPDPSTSLNAMTLAAQILAASAIRRKGTVRGIVYSSGPPLISPWIHDEETARDFLLHYAGGGTDYPFDVLRAHAEERADAVRVIISDWDFLHNVAATKKAIDALAFGVERSRVLVAFLAIGGSVDHARKTLAPVLDHPKFRLVAVESLAAFGPAATALAGALIGR